MTNRITRDINTAVIDDELFINRDELVSVIREVAENTFNFLASGELNNLADALDNMLAIGTKKHATID